MKKVILSIFLIMFVGTAMADTPRPLKRPPPPRPGSLIQTMLILDSKDAEEIYEDLMAEIPTQRGDRTRFLKSDFKVYRSENETLQIVCYIREIKEDNEEKSKYSCTLKKSIGGQPLPEHVHYFMKGRKRPRRLP